MVPVEIILFIIARGRFRKRFSLLVIAVVLTLLMTACANGENNNSNSGDTDNSVSEESGDSGDQGGQQTDRDGESEETLTADQEDEAGESETTTAEPTLEVTAEPNKKIVICMGLAPSDLSPFGDRLPSAEAIHHAIYEPLFTQIGYEYQARGLERLPSLENGDAFFQKVTVAEGDRVVNSRGALVNLQEDVEVINAAGETVTFAGTPLEMEQMVVEFSLKPMVWSDGQPVSAADSIYSYDLVREATGAFSSSRVHTAIYEATGERTMRWTGVPGYRDQTYFTNVWLPLPGRQDTAVTLADLSKPGQEFEAPLSSGPFVIDSQREDGSLVLSRNPEYYLADEGFPRVDQLIIRFGNGEDFLAGDQVEPCDVITNDALSLGNFPLLEMASDQGDWDILTAPGAVFENISFGVNPESEYAERRPDWFEDPRVRQAMTMCVDRERMVEELTHGQGQVIHTYIAPDHPLLPDDIDRWPYDPARANALLDEAGYLDFADDGRRQDVSSGVPMTITLGTNSESSLRLQISDIVAENLADCGIPVETYDLPAGTWFAPGPQGRLFGRRFDLAAFAWLSTIEPDCGLYISQNITGPEEFGFGGWQNVNVTGWSNEAFDAACNRALEVLPGSEEYDALQQEALRIFARELPAMPLMAYAKFAAIRPWIEHVQLDSTQNSLLWNVQEWDVAE